ncbi:hypothetical protein FQP85_23200 [Pseudoalteromonas neustonica]|uniref:EAL domain-containing protein n=1 Tax=Pseudoalteromonas neustonica TaxID=1840331 RepID=A0ABY3F870_9GAMM|nr:hypothetical protein [Pseudoalteromonas neustonica]TVU79597.1 hypothetical protein FQP85_23200 [Pseudoalteromonas neustonica]
MTNNITPLLDFIVLDDEQAPVLNEQGLPTLAQGPIVNDLAQLIAKGKVEHIEKFAEIVAQGEQWKWAQSYYDYLVELNRVNEYNANLPEPVANEDGTITTVDPLKSPTAPERPAVQTVEQVLAPYQRKIDKLCGIKFKGINISLSETNQNGLSALKSALELAKEFNVEEQFFPINFNAETCKGVEVVELLNETEFKQFGLDFILARKAFFS